MLSRTTVFVFMATLISFSNSNAFELKDFDFTANGISPNLNYAEAELNMKLDAKYKCDSIEGPIQISEIIFRENPKALYASALFECNYSALDRRKCNYLDDSNPDCFPPK